MVSWIQRVPKQFAGRDWMTEYLASLSDTERTFAVNTERLSSSIYIFGDGVESTSLKRYDIPMYIPGNKLIKLEVA